VRLEGRGGLLIVLDGEESECTCMYGTGCEEERI
jgi:hypothetical protein